MVIIVILPILLTLFAALKTKTAINTTSPLAFPALHDMTFDNFKKVLTDRYLVVGFRNTALILVVSLFFNVVFGTMTAFILERFEFRGKKFVISLFFLGMLIPSFVTEIARFRIIQSLHLYNTLGAPIVIYIASDLMQLYIYRQFISGLPVALDEAALLDGCSYFGLFWKIVFPLLAPATATVCIIKAIVIINDMYIPYLYMPKNIPDELCKCTAGFMADSCSGNYHYYDTNYFNLSVLPEIYSGRSNCRCSKGITGDL